MHLSCQQRMLNVAQSSDPELDDIAMLTRCRVCHEIYRNTRTESKWTLSWFGILWLTCCTGVLVMLWSGTTVLDRGSPGDPQTNFLSFAWWTYQFTHLTW